MKKYLGLMLCMMLFLTIGCSQSGNEKFVAEYEVTIHNININTPEGIEIALISADPKYLDRTESQETILSVYYNVKNNTNRIIKASDYKIYIFGYSSDGKTLFERNSVLFIKVSQLPTGTYTEGFIKTGFMRGVEKIDRLDIVVK